MLGIKGAKFTINTSTTFGIISINFQVNLPDRNTCVLIYLG